MNAVYQGEERNYPDFFADGDSLSLADAKETGKETVTEAADGQPTLTVSAGHIVSYRVRDFRRSKLDENRAAFDKLMQDYNRTAEPTEGTDSGQKAIFADRELDEKICELAYGLTKDQKLYINSRLPEVEDRKKQGAVALSAIAQIVSECGLPEDASCIIKCSSQGEYKGLLNLVGQPEEDISYTDTLSLSQLRDTAENPATELGEKLLAYLDYREIDDNSMIEVMDALRLTNHRRQKAGLDPFSIQFLRSYLNLTERMIDEKILKKGFRVVSITDSEEHREAFKGLLPENYDSTDHKDLLLGIVNEDNCAVGAMAVDETEEGYNINWLYVLPEERRKGAGTLLVQNLVDFISGTDDLNEISAEFSANGGGLRDFFEALYNFDVEASAQEYVISPEAQKESEFFAKMSKPCAGLLRYSQLTSAMQHEFWKTMRNSGVLTVHDPKWEKRMIDELCLCKVTDHQIDGEIIVTRTGEKENELSFLYSKQPKATMELISTVCSGLKSNYPDYALRVTPVNDNSEKMIRKFVGDTVTPEKRCRTSWNFS